MEAKNNTKIYINIPSVSNARKFVQLLAIATVNINHQASHHRFAGCVCGSVYILDVTLAPFIKTSFMKNANAERTGQPFSSAKPINSCHFRWYLFFVSSSYSILLIYLFMRIRSHAVPGTYITFLHSALYTHRIRFIRSNQRQNLICQLNRKQRKQTCSTHWV